MTIVLFFLMLHYALNSKAAQRLYFSILHKSSGWLIAPEYLSVKLFHGRLEIDGLKIMNKNQRDVITAKKIRVQISPWSLIRGRLTLSKIFLDEVVIATKSNPDPKKKKAKFPNLKKILGKIRSSVLIQNLYLDQIYADSLEIYKNGEKHFSLKEIWIHSEPSLFKDIHLLVKTQEMTAKTPLFERTEVDLTLKPKEIILQKVFVQHPYVEGFVSGNVKIEKDFVLEGHLQGEGMPRLASRIPFSFETQATLEHSFLTASYFTAHIEEARFEAQGTVDILDPKYEAVYSIENGLIERILPFFLQGDLPRGTVSLKGTISGYRREVKNHSTATFSDLHYASTQAPRLTADFDWQYNKMALKGSVLGEKGPLLDGLMEVTFKRDSPQGKLKPYFDLVRINFYETNMSHFFPELKISGLVHGSVSGKTYGEGLIAEGRLQIKEGRIENNTFEIQDVIFKYSPKELTLQKLDVVSPLTSFILSQPVYIQFQPQKIVIKGSPVLGLEVDVAYSTSDRQFNISSIKYTTNEGGFVLKGTYSHSGNMDFFLKGDFDASLLKFLKTVISDASGPMAVDLKIQGALKDPQLHGRVQFKKTNIDFRGPAKGFTDLGGELRLSGHKLHFDSLEGHWKDGSFKIFGNVSLQNLHPDYYDLTLSARNLTLVVPKILRLNFDGEATLKGKTPSPLLQAHLDIVEGRYFRKFKISELVFKPIEHERGEKNAFWDAVSQYRWDIHLRNTGDFRVKNNIADITFQSDLILKGTMGKPHVEGIITTHEGEIYYLGTEFEIVDGRVEFRDPYKIRPYLFIEANQRIRRSEIQDVYVVTVIIKGNLDNLEIELSSNPPKSREDILSLIAFGMTRDEFQAAKTRSRSSVASTILADELSGALERSIGKAAKLDIFRLEATDPDQAVISKLSVGKNITDRLSVEVSNDFLPESAERTVSSKYYLTDNFFLEGATTQRAEQKNRYQFNLSLRFFIR